MCGPAHEDEDGVAHTGHKIHTHTEALGAGARCRTRLTHFIQLDEGKGLEALFTPAAIT